MRIVPFDPSYSRSLATLHRTRIANGFISQLGERFLTSLYKCIARSPHGTVLIAVDETNEPLGFVAGATNIKKLYTSILITRWWLLALPLMIQLLRPSITKKIIETLVYGLTTPAGTSSKCYAELLSIVVESGHASRGIGGELVKALESWFMQRGVQTYKVVTCGADTVSNAFYAKRGFVKTRSFSHHDNKMYEYEKGIQISHGSRGFCSDKNIRSLNVSMPT